VVADIAENGTLHARLRAAFEEHSLLVFRDQRIDDEIQLAYSRRFGPLEITKIGTVGDPARFDLSPQMAAG
jgi:alpha-ketoglutarate-dependent 2,4-dichlorophenoxyacetate dioxygenase